MPNNITFSKGQLVAIVEKLWFKERLCPCYTLGIVLRIYKISALVRMFYENETYVCTVKFRRIVPAQKAFPWMKRYNARLVYDAQD